MRSLKAALVAAFDFSWNSQSGTMGSVSPPQGLKALFFYCSDRRPKGLLFHGSGYSNVGTAISSKAFPEQR
jgi:hypothetical protein